jgi:5'-nucleotidase
MKILLSNDDGYFASGIQALIKELEKKHDVYVAAPAVNHSAGSSALSVRKNIKVDNIQKNHYVIDGTPADSVHIALSSLIKDKIDMVVSGINLGANLGDDVIYSGTVAAALEGRHLEMSPIAISLVSHEIITIDEAAVISADLVERITLKKNISKNTLLNINIPDCHKKNSGIEYTKLGTRDTPIPAQKINDDGFYKIGAAGPPKDNSPGTDFFAISKSNISISPILYDLTDYNILKKINNI